jgi:hypothetical protein
MRGVSINDHKLHDVQMSLFPYNKGIASYLKYPKHRIKFEFKVDNLHLAIPAFLALELYRTGILPQNAAESVTVKVSGKKVGQFKVVDFRYPNSRSRDRELVTIMFQRIR